MRRSLACLFVALLLPVMGVVVDAAPAQACDCGVLGDEWAFDYADAVFVGRLIRYERPPFGVVSSSRDPAVWTFRVRDVYKGTVTRKQEVLSAVSGASCGLEIPKHGTFLVFAKTDADSTIETIPADGQLQAGLCGGTRLLGERAIDPSLGTAYPPERVRPQQHR